MQNLWDLYKIFIRSLFCYKCQVLEISLMIHKLHIHVFLHYRYDLVSNSWQKESGLPRKAPCNSSCGFVVLNGELHVLSLLKGGDTTESRRSRQQKRAGSLLIQIYQPRKRTWRSLITKPPFHCPLDFNTAVMCTIQL